VEFENSQRSHASIPFGDGRDAGRRDGRRGGGGNGDQVGVLLCPRHPFTDRLGEYSKMIDGAASDFASLWESPHHVEHLRRDTRCLSLGGRRRQSHG